MLAAPRTTAPEAVANLECDIRRELESDAEIDWRHARALRLAADLAGLLAQARREAAVRERRAARWRAESRRLWRLLRLSERYWKGNAARVLKRSGANLL